MSRVSVNNGANNPRRTRYIVQWYRNGKSMAWISGHYGVSVERVRQILRTQAPRLIRPVGRRML